MAFNPQPRRHPEAPRFLQRGEGYRADYSEPYNTVETPHARSLARLNNAVLRDDAFEAVRR